MNRRRTTVRERTCGLGRFPGRDRLGPPDRESGRFRPRGAIIPRWGGLGLWLLIAASSGGTAQAQDEVPNFKKPILMVETGGHHAPVRSLVWQDAFTLLSGGEDKVVKVWDFHDDV